MSVMLQETTEVHATIYIPRDEVLLRFEANSVGETCCLTVHIIRNDSMENQKLQQTIRQAVVLPPNPTHTALETRRTQHFERTLIRPLGTSLFHLRRNHTA